MTNLLKMALLVLFPLFAACDDANDTKGTPKDNRVVDVQELEDQAVEYTLNSSQQEDDKVNIKIVKNSLALPMLTLTRKTNEKCLETEIALEERDLNQADGKIIISGSETLWVECNAGSMYWSTIEKEFFDQYKKLTFIYKSFLDSSSVRTELDYGYNNRIYFSKELAVYAKLSIAAGGVELVISASDPEIIDKVVAEGDEMNDCLSQSHESIHKQFFDMNFDLSDRIGVDPEFETVDKVKEYQIKKSKEIIQDIEGQAFKNGVVKCGK